MDSILYLTPEHIMRLTREPSLYDRFKFLEPMQSAALTLHGQLMRKCVKCSKSMREKVATFIGAAMGALIEAESKKTDNKLGELREVVGVLLDQKPDKVRLVLMRGKDKVEVEF